MKKILNSFLCVALALSLLALAGCKGVGDGREPGKPSAPLKLGLGVHGVATKATHADGDTNGKAEAEITVAAVLVDAEGKIVKCVVDTAQNGVECTSGGHAVAKDSFRTKYEMGKDYGMVAHGGASKEWYQQADAFCARVAGKTVKEVQAMVATDGKGNADVIHGGCTVVIRDFVRAIEAAVANASASDATADSTLKLGIYTELSTVDATEEREGSSKLQTTALAAAMGSDGKILAASSDCVQVDFTFDTQGRSTYDPDREIRSKRTQGDAYGMKEHAPSGKEWYQQAAAFDAACIGKTPSEIRGLIKEDGYGAESLQAAGCTVRVNGFIGAASKLG